MKTRFRTFILTIVAGLLSGFAGARAADEPKPAPKESKKDLRVLAAPEHQRRMFLPHAGDKREPMEKEVVTFLGVETSPVSATLSAQLGLQKGSGLVVNHIVPGSPAGGALQEHDILLKLDDQILIETRQLSVLIRNRKEGDEVTLTYLRGGKEATARVKLGKHEVPKMAALVTPAVGALGFHAGPDGRFDYVVPRVDREEIDRVLSMIRRARPGPDGEPLRMQIERKPGAGLRAISINTGNSNLVFSDDDGSLELTMKDGTKTLVAKNAKGEPLFSGPVNSPEERKAMPATVRERLEKLEGMHDVTFRTDGDFQGAEVKVIRPPGRGISLPDHAPKRAGAAGSRYF